MMRSLCIGIVIVFLSISGARATCLDQVANFSDKVCGAIENSGKAQKLQADGALNTEAQGILKKVLGNAGADVDISYLNESFTGVLREELAGDRFDARSCRQNMVNLSFDKICISYKACRRTEFGLERYNNTQQFSGTTGWRGGGYNPVAWCNDFTRGTISSLKIGSKDYQSKIIGSSEESKKDWKGKVSYNYHCTIEVSWNPIYKQRIDAACGRN